MVAKTEVRVFVLLFLILLQTTYVVWSFLNNQLSDSFNTAANSSIHGTNKILRIIEDRSEGTVTSDCSSLLQEQSKNQIQPCRNSTSDKRRCNNLNRFARDMKSHFIINRSDACRESPFVVIMVTSSVSNWNLREVIRETWGKQDGSKAKILFLVGRSKNELIENCVFAENDAHNDIIMANFDDTYANLSLKSIAMLRWVMTYCPSIKFLVKADDDTFLNTPLLLKDFERTVHHRFIMGNVIALARPVREPTSKWFTPNSAFNRSWYPTYVSGMAYVISGDAIADLYGASLRIPVFWLEDVYITGLLAEAERIQLVFNGKFDGFKDLLDNCLLKTHIVRHRISVKEMQTLWTLVRSPHNGRCLSTNVY